MDVLMPQLGETVAEGKIVKWFKQAGDKVAAGDNLFEIETDKTSMEVPAITAGVLAEIRVPVGTVAPVGAVVAVIADGTAATSGKAAAPKASPPAMVAAFGSAKSAGTPEAGPSASAVPLPAQAPQRNFAAQIASPAPRAPETAQATSAPLVALEPFREVRTPARNYGPARLPNGAAVTPLARRLAVEAGVDLARVSASGPHGRILARDIGTAIASGAAAAPALRTTAPTPAARPSPDKVKSIYLPGSYEEVELDGMRRTIAARLTEAKQTIPHFYLTADFELDALLEVRDQANEKVRKGADGKPLYRLSVNDFLIKALAAALQRVPAANAAWAEDRILYFNSSDISVAVAIDGGLITPVLRHAEQKSVAAICQEMKDLAGRARARKLKPEEYMGGATTISNLGMYGVREFSAIINPPQATIFAIGAAERRPVEAKGGGIRFVTRMTVTVSCDHRVVDGALGAELLANFKGFVEQPVTALV
jgi:pyruvate dehydrogenase E2 component (dihydrolipoamide acetyltransferase)